MTGRAPACRHYFHEHLGHRAPTCGGCAKTWISENGRDLARATAHTPTVEIDLYHVLPVDSAHPPDGRVLTRVNSPSDNNFAAADHALGQLSFTTTVLNPSFTAANSVVNGINPLPNQFTGGEGAVKGVEVRIDITFITPLLVGPGHVSFRPEADLGSAANTMCLP